ncbi:hypothetical protein BsWGS_11869 [Bradybaena similaris]
MAIKRRGFGLLIITSLLSMSILAVVHEGAGADRQAVTESSKSEDTLGTDDTQRPVTDKQQGHPVDQCAGRTTGIEKAKEVCGKDLDEDKLTCSSREQCEAEFSGNIQRSVEGLEDILEKVEESLDQVEESLEQVEQSLGQVEESSVNVFEKLGGVMDQVAQSTEHMMKRLDKVMDRVSESVSESKVRVIQSLDTLMDHVSASKTKMMKEIDHVIDKVAHSKVIKDIRALPGEIQESFVLSVRNRSYVAAGVMVAITTAILVVGAVYYTWCHQDAGSYHRASLDSQAGHKVHGSPEGSVTYDGTAKGGAATQDVKNISNGHAAVHGDGFLAEGEHSPDGDPCQTFSDSLATKGSGDKWKSGHGDLQNVPMEGADVWLPTPVVSSCFEAVITPEVEVTHDVDDLHEMQLIEIPKDDIRHKCQQKDTPFKDEHENSKPNNEHQADTAFEYFPSNDQSLTLISAEILCASESKRDADFGCVESKDHQLECAFSGLGSDETVPVANSYIAAASNSNTVTLRNIGSVARVTGNSLGAGDIKKEYL